MVEIITQWMRSLWGIKIPTVLSYTSTRMMLAALTSLIICIFLGPRFIKKLYELKIGQAIRTEECPLLGELHAKKKDTPTMGGLLIIVSMLVSLFLWMDLTSIYTWILFLTTVVLAFCGGYDDYLKLKYKNPKGLSGKKKLLIQTGLSALIGLYLLSPMIQDMLPFSIPVIKEKGGIIPLSEFSERIYVPFFKEHVVELASVIALIFIVLVITGSSNAVNLTDGLDGLAAGCLIMVAMCLGFFAFLSNNIDMADYLNIPYIVGSGEIAVYMCAFAGACLGFLWYNGHPAQVFMGDTGSLALGGVIGVAAVLMKREFLLAIIGGVFVAEALSVIIQVGSYKLRNKKRVFLCSPLHHHFEYKGWPETKVVIRFWIVALLLAIVGTASIKFQ